MKIEIRDEIPIVIFGCVHIGSVHADLGMVQRYIDFVVKNNGYCLLIADNHECALPNKAQQMWGQNLIPQEQYDYGLKMFAPIKDRILGACTGNHTGRAKKIAGIDMDRCMAEHLGYLDRYHPYQGFISFKSGVMEYKIAFKHGKDSQNPFNNALQLLRAYPTADILCTSHMHISSFTKVGRWDIQDGKRVLREISMVTTGSSLDYPDYADEAGYPPQPKGFPILYLSTKTRYVRCETHPKDILIG